MIAFIERGTDATIRLICLFMTTNFNFPSSHSVVGVTDIQTSVEAKSVVVAHEDSVSKDLLLEKLQKVIFQTNFKYGLLNCSLNYCFEHDMLCCTTVTFHIVVTISNENLSFCLYIKSYNNGPCFVIWLMFKLAVVSSKWKVCGTCCVRIMKYSGHNISWK